MTTNNLTNDKVKAVSEMIDELLEENGLAGLALITSEDADVVSALVVGTKEIGMRSGPKAAICTFIISAWDEFDAEDKVKMITLIHGISDTINLKREKVKGRSHA